MCVVLQGASIIAMMKHFLGEDTFKKGLTVSRTVDLWWWYKGFYVFILHEGDCKDMHLRKEVVHDFAHLTGFKPSTMRLRI